MRRNLKQALDFALGSLAIDRVFRIKLGPDCPGQQLAAFAENIRRRQVLLARRSAGDKDLDENSPDHLGASLDVAEAAVETPLAPPPSKPSAIAAQVVPTALTQKEPVHPAAVNPTVANAGNSSASKLPASGTVVLDVEEGGIEMPSFLGKSMRSAIEAAQDAGLDLDAVGSGTAREQSPSPGTKVAVGSRVVVRFGR